MIPYNVVGNVQTPDEVASFGQFAVGTALDFARVVKGPTQRVIISRKVGNGYDTYVVFDCALNETYQHEAQPTSAAIDSGSVITDHVFVQPAEVQLTGIISDTPLGGSPDSNRGLEDLATQGVVSVANAAAGPLGVLAAGVGKMAYNALTKPSHPSVAAYIKLYSLMYGNRDTQRQGDGKSSKATGLAAPLSSAPELFRLTMGLKTFDNMVIRSMSVPRDNTTGNALVFNLSMVQLNVVQGQVISFTLSQDKKTTDAPKQKQEAQSPLMREANQAISDGGKAAGEVLPK